MDCWSFSSLSSSSLSASSSTSDTTEISGSWFGTGAGIGIANTVSVTLGIRVGYSKRVCSTESCERLSSPREGGDISPEVGHISPKGWSAGTSSSLEDVSSANTFSWNPSRLCFIHLSSVAQFIPSFVGSHYDNCMIRHFHWWLSYILTGQIKNKNIRVCIRIFQPWYNLGSAEWIKLCCMTVFLLSVNRSHVQASPTCSAGPSQIQLFHWCVDIVDSSPR